MTTNSLSVPTSLRVEINTTKVSSRKRNITMRHFTLLPSTEVNLDVLSIRYAKLAGRGIAHSVVLRRAVEALLERLDTVADDEDASLIELAKLLRHTGS
jgi:hypothetical protein